MNKVYGEIYDSVEVQSTAGNYRSYSIRLGEVSWGKDGEFVPAVYVIVKYNGIEKRDIPPHFLLEPNEEGISDLTLVVEAITTIKQRNKLI